VEAFFVVVMACGLLAVGIWALVAKRHLFTFTQTDSTQTDSSQRRPGDD
jgi:hypothetical protein